MKIRTRTLPRPIAIGLAALLALGAISCKGNRNDNSNVNGSVNTNAGVSASSGATDTALKNTVQANLTKYGVTGVTVSVSNGEVTLQGSVPRAKLQDAMKAANEANPKKVNNQMNVQ